MGGGGLTTRDCESLCLIQAPERIEAAKRKALQLAARKGWIDIVAGRYTDIADDRLEGFVGQLGLQAARRVPWAG